MYLSKIVLNPRDRRARRDIADPGEMHRTLLHAFEPEAELTAFRAKHGVLFRLESHVTHRAPVLLVQSDTKPNWSRLAILDTYFLRNGGANPDTKAIDDLYANLADGQVLHFRLRANPTKKIDTKTRPNGAKSNGKRIPLRNEDALIAWLWRKAEQGGFAPAEDPRTSVRVAREEDVKADRGGKKGTMTFGSVLFEGRLRITDAEAFRETLRAGLGPGKAFGFGLLSVAPV